MAYFPTSNNIQKTYSLTLKDFKGVDFTNSKLNVSPNRASDMKNMIYDGIDHKRPSWNEVLKGTGNVNGCWSYQDTLGNNHTIIHIGTSLYKVDKYDTTTSSYIDGFDTTSIKTRLTDLTPSNTTINDVRSNAIAKDDNLYIFCGTYLVYDGSTIKQVVNDEKTYIPTTTIGITCEESAMTVVRTSFEEVNLLSSYRKNTMFGEETLNGNPISQSNYATYKLDGELYIGDETDLTKVIDLKIETKDGIETLTYNLYDDSTIEIHDNSVEPESNFVGVIGGSTLRLYKPYKPILDGTTNITLQYKFNNTHLDDINKCKLCNLFSVEGGHFLFVSGNLDKPNYDWHSEYALNSTMQVMSDFTYFPDLSYTIMGNARDKIMGYTLVGDSTLAIHKEANGQRDTLYLRTASLDEALTYDGKKYYKVNFHLQQGATGEGMISSFANDNLLNDNLFLSRNGIFGLALTSNIKSNERYALERSGLINGALTKETSLENACAISFNGKFYLSVNDNCYVADSRFKNYVAQDLPDTFSYEWWFWDNIPARIFFIKDNELYFGTKDGQVCKFDFDTKEFSDKTYIDIGNADAIADITCNDSVFTINSRYSTTVENLKNGDTVRVYSVIDGVENDLKYLNNGTQYTLDKDCTIINYNKENSTFQLLWYENVNDDGSITQVPYTIDTSLGVAEYHAHFNISDNIQSTFYTYTTDFNDPSMEKVITKVTIVGDIKPNSKINFSIHTRNFNEKKVNVEGVNVFSFENINFGNFTFNTDTHQTSYTTKNLNIKCNFAYFSFSSINSGDCGIHEIIIKYRMTKENKGVK